MNNFKVSILFFTLLYSFSLFSQESRREKMIEALYLMDERNYSVALPIWKELQQNEPDNANINYNLGLCYLFAHEHNERIKSTQYLENATSKVSPNYDPFAPNEKRAPVDVHFYLGQAYHLEYEFIKAIESFNTFQPLVTERHYLYPEIAKNKQMAEYAQKAILNPVKVEINNLGGEMNSFYPDYSPVVTIDESAIYFTTRRLKPDSSNYTIREILDGQYYEDIFVSYNENGIWGKPKPLNINTVGHEATINLSIDGQTLYLYRDLNGNGELYESNFITDTVDAYEVWSEPKKLGSDINTKAYETHAAVTPDGRRLYFVSDREGGVGGKDIYFCNRLPTGGWALAQNAGSTLNTIYDEDGVFIHPDGKTMYFSSNGHSSMGGYDILSSELDDNNQWTAPVNMGYPINSVDDDVFFVTSPDGKRGYFSSFKEAGYGEKDIYVINLLDAEEKAITLYTGEFTFIERRTPPPGAQVTIINNGSGDLVGVYTPRQRDGKFSAILEPDESYHIIYEADDYLPYEEDIFIPSANNYREIYKAIQLKPVRVGEGRESMQAMDIGPMDVKGEIVQKTGEPLKNMNIVLVDEERSEVLTSTTTDDVGIFNFTKLDPSRTYLVQVEAENPDEIIEDDNLFIQNDKGETLIFEKVKEGTYRFVPSMAPPKVKLSNINGAVTSKEEPITDLNVLLLDKDDQILSKVVTDSIGKFDFMQLDLTKSYTIKFEGDFPEDAKLVVANDQYDLLLFRKVAAGLYKYDPVFSAKLLNEKEEVLRTATTDKVGQFNFQKLKMDEAYTIEFDGDFPEDSELVFVNDLGESFTFKKETEGIYKYVPESNLTAKASKGETPLVNADVRLVDKDEGVLQTTTTDQVGQFTFSKLRMDQPYKIIFDADFPDDTELVIVNDFGEELTFNKVEDGVYEFKPESKSGVDMVGIQGSLGTPSKGAVKDVPIQLLDENGALLASTTTDEQGNFAFSNLAADKYHRLVIQSEDDDILLAPSLSVRNDDGELLEFKRVSPGVFEFIPKLPAGVEVEDVKGNIKKGEVPITSIPVKVIHEEEEKVIASTTTDEFGNFEFKKLRIDQNYLLIVESEDADLLGDANLYFTNDEGEKLEFVKIGAGKYKFTPVSSEGQLDGPLVFDIDPMGKKVYRTKSYTLEARDGVDYEESIPSKKELLGVIAYFQKFFPYNAKDISRENEKFNSFILDIAQLVRERGYADIIITSSASKVPTKTWKTNTILTRKRAYDTKALLESVFKQKGIKPEQYNFVDINTLITGPEYKNDFLENKATYEKYQYVRIFIK